VVVEEAVMHSIGVVTQQAMEVKVVRLYTLQEQMEVLVAHQELIKLMVAVVAAVEQAFSTQVA